MKFNMKSNLKYLYRVVYRDGTIYDQNHNDISIANPEKSCYNDLKLDQIALFILSDGRRSYLLDLADGGFSVDGCPKFYLTTEELKDLKLTHFRRVTMDIVEDTRSMTINYILGYTGTTVEGTPVSNHIVIK